MYLLECYLYMYLSIYYTWAVAVVQWYRARLGTRRVGHPVREFESCPGSKARKGIHSEQQPLTSKNKVSERRYRPSPCEGTFVKPDHTNVLSIKLPFTHRCDSIF